MARCGSKSQREGYINELKVRFKSIRLLQKISQSFILKLLKKVISLFKPTGIPSSGQLRAVVRFYFNISLYFFFWVHYLDRILAAILLVLKPMEHPERHCSLVLTCWLIIINLFLPSSDLFVKILLRNVFLIFYLVILFQSFLGKQFINI